MAAHAPAQGAVRVNVVSEKSHAVNQSSTAEEDEDETCGRNGQRRVTMKTVRIAEVVYDVRQYWGLRKLLIDFLLLFFHFLSSNFLYQPLSGEIRAYAQTVLVTGIVNGAPDNRPNPVTLFDAGTIGEAMTMLHDSLTYWGEASYGPDASSMYLGQSSLRVRALVVQIDPLNQCGWGTEVTEPPLCYRDDPAAVAEFSNQTRWIRVEGEAAAPRASLVRYFYPTGESAGTLHEGSRSGNTPRPDLHFPILLDHFNRTEYQARVDELHSTADIVATYSKFVQLFVITEHLLTGEISHQRIAFDRSIPPFDSGMLFAATTPRIIVWNSASPIFAWPERPGKPAPGPQSLSMVFHVASNILMIFIVRDLFFRFRIIRHHRRCVRMAQAPHLYFVEGARRDSWRERRQDNIDALLLILRPFSWTSFDVCVLGYGLLFENVVWNAVILVPPFLKDTGILSVADVLHITMHSNYCVVWICSDGIFIACLFFRLFESVFKFRRLAMYVRVFELAFGQFKDYAIFFLSLLMCGSLGFSFVCQGLGGGTGFSSYTAAVNSWSLFVFRFYDYSTFSQNGKWIGFGLPLMGIAFFWVAVILCVIFSQNIILAVIMAAHNAAMGELEESYGLDCQVSFAMYCFYRACQSVGRLFSIATALSVRGGRRRRAGGVGYALGGLLHDLVQVLRETRAKGLGWMSVQNQVAPAPAPGSGAGSGPMPGLGSRAGSSGSGPGASAGAAPESPDPKEMLRRELQQAGPATSGGGSGVALAADETAVLAGSALRTNLSGGSSTFMNQFRKSLNNLGLGPDPATGSSEGPLEKDVRDAASALGLSVAPGAPLPHQGAARWFPSSVQMHQCLSRWELIEEAAPMLLRLVEFYTNPASGRLHDKSPFASVLARQDGNRRGGAFGGAGGAGALGLGEQEIPALNASLDAHEMAQLFARMRLLMDLGEDYQPAARPATRAGEGPPPAAGCSKSGRGAGSSLLSGSSALSHLTGGTARSSNGARGGIWQGQSPGASSPQIASSAAAGNSDGASHRGSAGRGWAARPQAKTLRPTEEESVVSKRLQRLYGSVPTNSTRKPGVQLSTLGQMASIQGQMHRIQRPLRERGWDCYISYSRENAEGHVSELRLDLLMVGHKAWLDLYENSSPEGVFQGIMQSDVFVLYLTRGVLSHRDVQLELATALEARKLIVLVRECRTLVFYRDRLGAFQNACASVTEVKAEAPAEFHAVFEACLALEATDYKDVSERRLFIEHLMGGKNAQVVEMDSEVLAKWTRSGGEYTASFRGGHHLERLNEMPSEELRESASEQVGGSGRPCTTPLPPIILVVAEP